MDGFDATLHIRQSPNAKIANVIILALTASAIAGDRERFLGAGMNGYLSKVGLLSSIPSSSSRCLTSIPLSQPVRSKVLEAVILDHLLPLSNLPVPKPEFPFPFDSESDRGPDLGPNPSPDVSLARRRPSHPSYSPAPVK